MKRKNKRGPIPGKPKPAEAEIISMINEGMSQSEITDALKLIDEDPKRKIRRIMRKLESACCNRESRKFYESGINAKRKPEDRLWIFSADYDAFKAFPDLAAACRPQLLTGKEIFKVIADSHEAAIEAITKATKPE